MHMFLIRYPFSDPAVQLVEGFAAYDGVLGDPPGSPHKGIDYVLAHEAGYRSFDVHVMHDGLAYQGVSQTWGNFVVVYISPTQGALYRTVYAHLDDIPLSIPQHIVEENGKSIRNPVQLWISSGERVGRAGVSGLTHGVIQLHVELQDVTNMTEDESTVLPVKMDPYGVYDRASSGKYPQPGSSLSGLSHAWTTDSPRIVL